MLYKTWAGGRRSDSAFRLCVLRSAICQLRRVLRRFFSPSWSAGLQPALRGGAFKAGCKPALHFGCGFAALCLCGFRRLRFNAEAQRTRRSAEFAAAQLVASHRFPSASVPTRRFRTSAFGYRISRQPAPPAGSLGEIIFTCLLNSRRRFLRCPRFPVHNK